MKLDTKSNREKLGIHLRICREEKRLSILEVNKATGIDYTRLIKIENGECILTNAELIKLKCLYNDKYLDRLIDKIEYTFKTNLIGYIEIQGLSFDDIANKLKVSIRSFYRILNGEKALTTEQLNMLKELLEIDDIAWAKITANIKMKNEQSELINRANMVLMKLGKEQRVSNKTDEKVLAKYLSELDLEKIIYALDNARKTS